MLWPPGDSSRLRIQGIDKIAHIVIYLGLSVCLLYQYFVPDRWLKSAILTFLFATSYGLLLEILQNTSFSQREFDIFDVGANIIGVIIGIAFYLMIKIKFYE